MTSHPTIHWKTPPCAEIRNKASDLGIGLYAGGWSICPTSVSFKKDWGTAEEHLITGIRVARALGSPVYRAVLGTSDDRKTPGGIRARIADTIKVLRACRTAALDSGIKVAIENHAGDMHSWELRDLVEEAGADFVGVNIGSGNAAWTLKDPQDVLENLGKYTVCSSLRDNMIWETPEGASVQWTAAGEELMDWNRYVSRWAELCPKVPVVIGTISGFARSFPYKKDEFWAHYDKRPDAQAHFEALAKRGKPIPPCKADDPDRKKLEQDYQKAELARKVGITPTSLYRIETGIHTPRPATIRKIAEVLGMDPGELAGVV